MGPRTAKLNVVRVYGLVLLLLGCPSNLYGATMPLKRACIPLSFRIPIVSALVVLVGCAPIQIAMGARVRLDKIQVKEISAQLQEGTSLWPGGSAPLVVKATAEDGKEYVTEGAGHGKVLWDSYRIESTGAAGATVNGRGVVKLNSDPRDYAAHPLRLRITALSNPERNAEMDLPVRYDVPFEARFSGSSGFSGLSGSNGSTGSSGSSGSMDPKHPSVGGNGGRGGDGGTGRNGGNGGNGPDVQVSVTLQPGTKLLQVRIEAQKALRYFLVDPNGGSLLIRSDGGSGGSGARGGRGGSGGRGGIGWPSGSTGLSGNAGRDGSSGSAGRDGRITVMVDPSAQPFLKALQFSNRGSLRGGSDTDGPEIREVAIAPLW